MHGERHIPHPSYQELPAAEMLSRAEQFADHVHRRRTVREFSTRPVAREVIAHCIRAAGAAPSGANQQPWRYVAVSDPRTKSVLRAGVEQNEREFYEKRAPEEWLNALKPIGTDEHKPYLDDAPWLIVVFGQLYTEAPGGEKLKNYYVPESVMLSCGILITALHNAGLVSVTHTPSPMGFLAKLLGRPDNERAMMLIAAGYPSSDAKVPDIRRLALEEYVKFVEAGAD